MTEQKTPHPNHITNRNTLVLGMVHVTQDVAAKAVRHLAPNTSSSLARDYLRFKMLEARNFDREFFSLAHSLGSEHGEPIQIGSDTVSKHICANIERNGADAVQKHVAGPSNSLPFFDTILLDFIRFPSSYMIQAYQGVFEFVERLYELGLIDEWTRIWMPNYKPLMDICGDRLSLLIGPTIVRWMTETDTYHQENSNPLVVVVHDIERAIKVKQGTETGRNLQQVYGAYRYKREVKQLDKERPFICMRVFPPLDLKKKPYSLDKYRFQGGGAVDMQQLALSMAEHGGVMIKGSYVCDRCQTDQGTDDYIKSGLMANTCLSCNAAFDVCVSCRKRFSSQIACPRCKGGVRTIL